MKERISSREEPAGSDLSRTKPPKLPWLYCDCRYISVWLLIVILLSTALGVAIYFLVLAKAPYSGPPFLPDTIRPISYNVTLRLYTTFDNERTDYGGSVTIELICVNNTNQVNIHKGDNLQIDQVLVSTTDGTKAPSVDSIRHDSQTDITTIQLNGYLLPSTTYLLEIVSFSGQMSKDQSNQGLVLYQYRTSVNQTRYGATFASNGGGLRHVFPSFDSSAFPATFNFVIERAATLRSLTNAVRDSSVKENEQFLDDYFVTTPVFLPTDIAIVITDFQYIRFEQDGLQVDVFSRPDILSNISASATQMVSYADSRSSDMGKLEVVVVPGLSTRFDKPGLSLVPEIQALDDDWPSSSER